MDEEHTRGTIMNFLQINAFIYLLLHIFYYVFNLFNLKIYLTTAFDSRLEFTILVHLVRALQLPKSGDRTLALRLEKRLWRTKYYNLFGVVFVDIQRRADSVPGCQFVSTACVPDLLFVLS